MHEVVAKGGCSVSRQRAFGDLRVHRTPCIACYPDICTILCLCHVRRSYEKCSPKHWKHLPTLFIVTDHIHTNCFTTLQQTLTFTAQPVLHVVSAPKEHFWSLLTSP
jgi:hypothetical protein